MRPHPECTDTSPERNAGDGMAGFDAELREAVGRSMAESLRKRHIYAGAVWAKTNNSAPGNVHEPHWALMLHDGATDG